MSPTPDHDELWHAYLAGASFEHGHTPGPPHTDDLMHADFEQWLAARDRARPCTICVDVDHLHMSITEAENGSRTTSFGGTYHVVPRAAFEAWDTARKALVEATRQLLVAGNLEDQDPGHALSIER